MTPQEAEADLLVCLGGSGAGVGQRRPAAGLGHWQLRSREARSAGQVLLKEVTITPGRSP